MVAIFDANNPTSLNYYAHTHRQTLQYSRKSGTTVIYNPLPNLNPTPESIVRESITRIMKELQRVADGS